MNFLLLFLLTINSDKTVEVRYTDTAPRIDGVIEEVWQTADSAYDFVQFEPYENEEPTEKTVVMYCRIREISILRSVVMQKSISQQPV